MPDVAAIKALLYARNGEVEKLARHIETGGTIDDDIRNFLAQHLRGQVPITKRIWSQQMHELRVLQSIRFHQRLSDIRPHRQASEYEAMKRHSESIGVPFETVRTWVRRARKRWEN